MRLQSTQFDKKSYMVYIKDYMKSVGKYLEENAPDRVEPFKKNIQPFIKKVLENFKDWEFYTGENMIPEGMVALLNYREDGVTPFFVCFTGSVWGFLRFADQFFPLTGVLPGWAQGGEALDCLFVTVEYH
jgi:hypothetical protein